MTVSHDDVQGWLDRYIEAWRLNDPALIGSLFTDDAEYRYHPWDDPVAGREAIVAGWLDDPDPPGSWRAAYRPLLLSGNEAVATGTSEYAHRARYWNIFLLTFDGDGRVSRFTEWFMRQPD